MHNIEKSKFRRGQYIGYGGGKLWNIMRTDGGWKAINEGSTVRGKTLADISQQLTERDKPKTNPRPRIGAAKPSRPSSATGKRPSKRLVSRRKANTRKGYFPNPAEVARAHENVIRRAAYSGSAKDYPYVIQGENYQTKKWNTIAMYAIEADAREAIKLLASRYRTPLRLMKR